MTEHTIKYVVDEKDLDLGFNVVRNRDLLIRVVPETDTCFGSMEVVYHSSDQDGDSEVIYHIVLNYYSCKIFTFKFIYFNNTRTLLINNYQVLQDKYTNFKTFELETMLPVEHTKFDSKKIKKEESDYEYIMSLAKEDDSVKNVLGKCGFCI